MIKTLIFTSIAGIIGTGLGGVISAIYGKKSDKVIGNLLSVAGGIMISITFFDLIPEAIEYGSFLICLGGMLFAFITLLFLEYAISNSKTYSHIQSLSSTTSTLKDKKTLYKIGILMFLAISIHNFPEGMAMGSLGAIDSKMLIPLSLLIFIHNIPEGMAISTPLIAGGTSPKKAILFSILAGSITILGGLVGLIFGCVNNATTAFALAFAGGSMLYVTLFELLPETYELSKNKSTQICLFLGVLLGFILIYLV